LERLKDHCHSIDFTPPSLSFSALHLALLLLRRTP
jgi:hypothetical protein